MPRLALQLSRSVFAQSTLFTPSIRIRTARRFISTANIPTRGLQSPLPPLEYRKSKFLLACVGRRSGRFLSTSSAPPGSVKPAESTTPTTAELHESPFTIPNALTVARILACPVLGYTIVQGQYEWATGILLVGGLSDWLDGYLARRWNQQTVIGSILDPMADKTLMTTLVATLAWSGLLPIPLAILIFGRDVALSLSAFYFRYISLPPPRTLKRYFDPSMPSAEVKPTQISKINTALQLLLMGLTTVSPLLGLSVATPLYALQWTVAGTTIWSGLSYVGGSGAKILTRPSK
ncbi:cardiolipin synthase (CMP-forming), partial [Tremellales sp. Uapishka_1]